jgi:16S rRNA G966 N2-methylase RsmD
VLDENPGWVSENTILIIQIDPKEQHEIQLKHLMPYDERRYGHTMLWFFEANSVSGDTQEEN